MLHLLALLACKGDPSPDSPTDDTTVTGTDDTTADDSSDDSKPDSDCDPIPEVCDGMDQDCDDAVDEGIPGDGQGCPEPEPPTLGETASSVQFTLHAWDTTYAGTDDGLSVCLSSGDCFALARPDWNDNEPGVYEVYDFPGQSLTPADLVGAVLHTNDGGDQYRPQCIAASLDGLPQSCSLFEDVKVGTDDDDEVQDLPIGDAVSCTGCWDSPLTHGPMLGALESDALTLWTRLDATRRLDVYVGRPGETGTRAHTTYPSWENDFTSQVRIQGLAPGDWTVRVDVDGATQGTWTVALPEPSETLKFAFGSCSKDAEQPIFDVISAWDPDLFLFVGDNHYANSADLGAHRQHYRFMLDIEDRADFLAQTPVLATWDDHDFVGNNTDASDAGGDVALDAFREYWPTVSTGTESVPGAYSRHRVDDVEFFLVDDRMYRGMGDTMLGDQQMAWLRDALAGSDATFKFVACGSQWSEHGSSDSWAAFDDDREAFHAWLVDQQIGGLILLSGDVHRSELRDDPTVPWRMPEWTSSPLATWNSGCKGTAVACLDEGTSFVGVQVDLSVDDPTATGTIYDSDGNTIASMTVARSELGP